MLGLCLLPQAVRCAFSAAADHRLMLSKMETMHMGQDQAAAAWWARYRAPTRHGGGRYSSRHSLLLLDDPLSHTMQRLAGCLAYETVKEEFFFRPMLWPITVFRIHRTWEQLAGQDKLPGTWEELVDASRVPKCWERILKNVCPLVDFRHVRSWDEVVFLLEQIDYTNDEFERAVEDVIVKDRDYQMAKRLVFERRHPDKLCVAVLGDLHVPGVVENLVRLTGESQDIIVSRSVAKRFRGTGSFAESDWIEGVSGGEAVEREEVQLGRAGSEVAVGTPEDHEGTDEITHTRNGSGKIDADGGASVLPTERAGSEKTVLGPLGGMVFEDLPVVVQNLIRSRVEIVRHGDVANVVSSRVPEKAPYHNLFETTGANQGRIDLTIANEFSEPYSTFRRGVVTLSAKNFFVRRFFQRLLYRRLRNVM